MGKGNGITLSINKDNPEIDRLISTLFDVAFVRNFMDYSWCADKININDTAYFIVDTNGCLQNSKLTESIDTMFSIKQHVLKILRILKSKVIH
jgi:hypothetical protein